jgi:hypothetical protein
MPDSELELNPEPQVHRKRSRRHTCPACGHRSLAVIHRRAVDRMISRFFPLRRYRCSHRECDWEGVLPSSEGRKKLQTFWKRLLWTALIFIAFSVFCVVLWYLLRGG